VHIKLLQFLGCRTAPTNGSRPRQPWRKVQHKRTDYCQTSSFPLIPSKSRPSGCMYVTSAASPSSAGLTWRHVPTAMLQSTLGELYSCLISILFKTNLERQLLHPKTSHCTLCVIIFSFNQTSTSDKRHVSKPHVTTSHKTVHSSKLNIRSQFLPHREHRPCTLQTPVS